jgi:hypothetical protein
MAITAEYYRKAFERLKVGEEKSWRGKADWLKGKKAVQNLLGTLFVFGRVYFTILSCLPVVFLKRAPPLRCRNFGRR